MEKLRLFLIDGPKIVHCEFKTRQIEKSPTGEKAPINCEYAFELKINSKQKELWALLKARSDSALIPFSFDVQTQAKFKFNDIEVNNEDNKIEAIAAALPYTFTFLREIIADLTRKSSFPPFYLPYVDINPELIQKTKADDVAV